MSPITEEVKAHILRVIPLGVDLFTAGIQAHLTLDQIKELEDDKEFSRQIEYVRKKEEIRLLEAFDKTIKDAAVIKQNYKGYLKKLEIINPERYSQKGLNMRVDNKPKDNDNQVQIIKLPDNKRAKNGN